MRNDATLEQMVEQQVRAWDVLDERVLDTFRQVPRELFVPSGQRYLAYADLEIALPHDQHMLRPNVAGRLLQALGLAGPERVLEIGAGSGFLSACLAVNASEVHCLELYADLAELARTNLASFGLKNCEVAVADATQMPVSTRYDAVAVTASLPVFDERYQRLLNVGGRLFLIVGSPPAMEAILVRCVAEGVWARESLFETVVDPLINAPRAREFIF
jgi:protein-L-isoaspartate(D-aspartate) O-methyltransferase